MMLMMRQKSKPQGFVWPETPGILRSRRLMNTWLRICHIGRGAPTASVDADWLAHITYVTSKGKTEHRWWLLITVSWAPGNSPLPRYCA